MEKLIPYSIHLQPDIYEKVKKLAGERKASVTIRNAINAYVRNEDAHKAGFRAGLLHAIEEIRSTPLANHIKWQDESMADMMTRILEESFDA
jgi:predicted transcriptional regulator